MASLLGSILLSACSVVGIRSGTEEPPFTVLDRSGDIEVRQYGARVAAETTVDDAEVPARSQGFRRLAGYIFGRNAGSARITMTAPVAQGDTKGEVLAMSAPVAQGPGGAGSTIRFFLPTGLTADAAPRPLDARVRIVEIPAQTVAALRFSGSTGPEAVAVRKAALLAGLSATRWMASGAAFAWFYDPPWTLPPLRRNEVVVVVRRSEPAATRRSQARGLADPTHQRQSGGHPGSERKDVAPRSAGDGELLGRCRNGPAPGPTTDLRCGSLQSGGVTCGPERFGFGH